MSYSNTLAHLRITADWTNHVSRTPPSRGGVDYGCSVGTPILAPCDGRLENLANNGTGGHTATFHHTGGLGKGWRDQYMHLSKFAEAGTYKAGDVIGYSGGKKGAPGAGSSTGPHIHHHLIKPDGTRVDPRLYVTGAAPAAPAPADPNAETITVQKGDSYWAIAERVWGGSDAQINDNMKRLQALNGNKRLYAGNSVVLRAGKSDAELAAEKAKAAADAAAVKANADAAAAAATVKAEQEKAAAAARAAADAAIKLAQEQASAEAARQAAAKQAATEARKAAAAAKKAAAEKEAADRKAADVKRKQAAQGAFDAARTAAGKPVRGGLFALIASRDFWNDALTRAVNTFFQVALAAVGTGAAGLTELDYLAILNLAAGGAVLSLAQSIVRGTTPTVK